MEVRPASHLRIACRPSLSKLELGPRHRMRELFLTDLAPRSILECTDDRHSALLERGTIASLEHNANERRVRVREEHAVRADTNRDRRCEQGGTGSPFQRQ